MRIFHGFSFVGAFVRWRHPKDKPGEQEKSKVAMDLWSPKPVHVRTVRHACMVHVCAGSLATIPLSVQFTAKLENGSSCVYG